VFASLIAVPSCSHDETRDGVDGWIAFGTVNEHSDCGCCDGDGSFISSKIIFNFTLTVENIFKKSISNTKKTVKIKIIKINYETHHWRTNNESHTNR
jgi:hypothetical protein